MYQTNLQCIWRCSKNNWTPQLHYLPYSWNKCTCSKGKAKPAGVLFTSAPGIPVATGEGSQEPVDNPSVMPAIPSTPTSQPSPAKKKRKCKIYLCDQCSKDFVKKTDYDDHMSKFDKVGKDLACNICGKDFSTWMSMKQHIRTQHHKILKYPLPSPRLWMENWCKRVTWHTHGYQAWGRDWKRL